MKNCFGRNINIRRIILLFTFVLASNHAWSQSRIDSLKNRADSLEGNSRIDALVELARELNDVNVRQADSVAHMVLRLSEDSNYPFGLANSLRIMGIVVRNNGDFDLSLKYFLEADSLYKILGKAKERAYLLNEISIVFANSGDIAGARNYFFESLSIFEELGEVSGQGQMHHNIAVTYDLDGNFDKAMYHYRRGYQLKSLAGDRRGVANSLNNLAVVLLDMGMPDSSVFYAKKAYEIYQDLGSKRGMQASYNQIGQVYQSGGNPELALPYYIESYKIAKELGDLEFLVSKSEDLMEIFRELGDLNNAFVYHDEFMSYYDSLQTKIKDEALAEQKVRFELEKKNELLDSLQRNQRLERLIQIVLFLLVLIMSVFAWILYTERKKLSELNGLKDQLFTIISHDLRDPIHTLSGFLELMKEGSIERDEMIEISKSAYREMNSTAEMLNNLLNWAKSQLKGEKFTKEPVNLAQVANEVLKLYKIQADEKNVHITMFLDQQLSVETDKSAIRLILRNLIGNAIKFTPSNKRIQIKSEEVDSKVVLIIEDEGVGMSDEDIQKVLSGKKLSTRGTNNEPGSGIGLFISRRIALALGIDFQVESKLGSGTSFKLTFP